jgi:hypothetical protein
MPSHLSDELLLNTTVSISGTKYSNSMDFRRCAGNAALFVTSSAGSITITQQCSYDDLKWYDPTDSTGAQLGIISGYLSSTSGVYIPFTPVLTKHIRFKVLENGTAETAVTLRLIYRLET